MTAMSEPVPSQKDANTLKRVQQLKDGHYADCHLQSTAFDGGAATSWLSQNLAKLPENLDDADWVLKLIEDIITFFFMINTAHTEGRYSKKRIVFACVTFAKLRTTGSFMNSIISKKLLECYDSLFNDAEPEIQGIGENIRDCRDILNKYDSIKDSVVFKKLYKVMMYAMSLSVFDKLGLSFTKVGYTNFETEALKKKYVLGPDLIHTLLDTLLFLCERGFQILKTGNYEYMFHSSSTYSAYYDQYVLLKRRSTLLTNPEAHGFKESTYRADLEDAIERGASILKHGLKMSPSDRRLFLNMHNDLQMIQCDLCTKRAARKHRKAPFSVLIFGESGIGKSTIKDLLFNQYAGIKGLENDSSFCYTRNPVANFWDGFTTSQWALVLDDIAAIHPDKAPNGDPSMMELIQIVNSIPFVPDQADLANKGRTPLKCEFVMATTNVKTLNAFRYFSHPSAVQRRLPFIITPVVKKQFAHPDGSLDSTKTFVEPGQYPDWWSWTVEHVLISKIANPQKIAQTEIIIQTDSIIDLLKWFNKAVKTFDDNQTYVENSVDAMKTVELCKVCYLPPGNCDCTIQALGAGWAFFYRYFLYSLLFSVLNFLNILWLNTFDVFIQHYFGDWIIFILIQTGIARLLGESVVHRLIRARVQRAGQFVQHVIGYPKVLVAVVTILGSGTILYKMCKFYTTQGDISNVETGRRPEAKNDEPENVWYNNNFVLSSFETTPQILSSKALTRDQFVKMIENNCIYGSFRVDGLAYTGRFTCLKGQKYIGNNHIIPILTKPVPFTFIQHATTNGVNMNMEFLISESQILRDPKNDVLIITIPNLPPKRDITKYIPRELIDIKTNGFYASRQSDGSLRINNLSYICKRGWNGYANIPHFEGSIWSATSKEPTYNGECGSLFVGETVKGFMILGIHVLKSNTSNCVGATDINQRIVNDILKEDMYTIQAGKPRLDSESVKRDYSELHYKSPMRYLTEGTAAVYGSFNGFRPAHKSTVEVSPLAHHLSEEGYKIKFGKPDMRSYRPWFIAATDMTNPVTSINMDVLKRCEDSFLADIIGGLELAGDDGDLSQLHVYDLFTAINGAKGVAYVDKLKRNTSAGNPWKKGKKHFMFPIPEEDGLPDPVDIVDEIKDNISSIIQGYHKRERQMPNYCAHLKDEPVSFKKVMSGKTRVFVGAPMDWSIVVRKYLLCIVRLIQRNQFVFESAPGIIAQSPQWSSLYERITLFGTDRIIAGDYRAFDKTMPSAFILSAFNIITQLCSLSGNFSSEDISVIEGIAQDIAFPLVDYNGDIVEFYGSNPSGHPLTVIVNGLVNALYMRYTYHELNPDSEVRTFRDNVALMTYGDDNIMSVSKEITWYDHTTIASKFYEMGITYTMADKEAISIPFVHISEASFLKRTWTFSKELGYYLAPLEHESIEKSLMVWTRSKSISPQEQLVSIIGNANQEYFFYGKEIFNQKQGILRRLIELNDLTEWLQPNTLMSWDALVEQYLSNANTKGF